ncbi:MAG: nucleotidyltransferase family protein [Clostridia bacterium]|nr:nucleotidyltransferase family protein [Clostridia bacterium]MBR2734687.1 nucleotidyltransferase family protein [Clostridia bacterium]
MKICAVIAEFNPFHCGHKYIIEQAAKAGFTHIVAIMSGNFVQRGEPAIFSKKIRTQTALSNGVDLVVEMPCVWALSSAEKYAETGVYLANALGCVDSLVFGSECGDLEKLSEIEKTLRNPEFHSILQNNLKQGITFAKAREQAISDLLKSADVSEILSTGNNILGIEYIKAIRNLNSDIKPLTFRRNKNFKSASQIRELIKRDNKSYRDYAPYSAEILESPKDIFWGEKGIISVLKNMHLEDFAKLPDISEGLENKIYNSLSKCSGLENLLSLSKSKRYTMSRIKRIIMCAYLRIYNNIQSKYPPYLRVLGATKKGLEILNTAKQKASLPIISKFSDLSSKDDFSKKVFETECRATELYGVFGEKLEIPESDKKFKFIRQD